MLKFFSGFSLNRKNVPLIAGFAFAAGLWAVLIFASFNRPASNSFPQADREVDIKNAIGNEKNEIFGSKNETGLQFSPSPALSDKTKKILGGQANPSQPPVANTQTAPARDPAAIDLPAELSGTSGTFPVSKGELSFKAKADWGNEDRHLVWGNYNGDDIKSLFMVVGSGDLLVFDVYTGDGNEVGECNVDFTDRFDGTEYSIRLVWDFETERGVKKVYVNGILKRECETFRKPADNGGKIYIGQITDFIIKPL